MSNTPAPTGNRLPVWVLLLIAVGVPSAAGIAFAEQVTQEPWKAVGLALLYEVTVLALGFVTKVWEKLEESWVKDVAGWLDGKIRNVAFGYRKRYLQHLIYRHRSFDVKGLTTQSIYTLELEQVFVELSIAPQPPHRASTDPLRVVPEDLRQGNHPLWGYLNASQMAGQHLAIIGPPGSGKTTLLKHITISLASKKSRRRSFNTPNQLPILLFLRDHAETIATDPDFSLPMAVQGILARWQMQATPNWFEQQLRQMRCLVLLDGLDEVANHEARQKVVAWVERQMEIYAGNRFIITSRPHGYQSNPLQGVTVLEVQPFNSEQIRRFVSNWYIANEIMSSQKNDPGVHMVAQEGAEDLLQRLRNTPALSALAVNPLLLTMIATIHRYKSQLPGRRVELYREICEVFLGSRQQARGLTLDLTPAQKQSVLQPLAYHMMQHEQRELKLEEVLVAIAEPLKMVSPNSQGEAFLKMIENSSGLLLEKESGQYSFAHLTFQEYLAAVHVQEGGLEAELVALVAKGWWHETIRLYVAQTDATAIIGACLADIRTCLADEIPSVSALTLAIECLEEARLIQPTIREQVETILKQGVEDKDPERRRLVAEALLSLRLRRLRRVSEDKYIDDQLISHAEYQLFLDEQRDKGRYHQPAHWLTFQFPEGRGLEPVVGVRAEAAEAFCQWLTERELEGWRYRLPWVNEADKEGKIQTDQAGYWAVKEDDTYLLLARLALIPGQLVEMWLKRDLPYLLLFNISSTLARARTLAHTLAIDLARTFASDRDLANALNLAVAHAFDLERALASTSDLARANDLDRALYRTRDLNLVSDRDLSRNLALARDRVRDLTHALPRARELALAVAHDLTRARDRIRALDFDRDLDLDRASTRADNLETILEQALNVIGGLALDFQLIWTLDLDLNIVFDAHYNIVKFDHFIFFCNLVSERNFEAKLDDTTHFLASHPGSISNSDLDSKRYSALASTLTFIHNPDKILDQIREAKLDWSKVTTSLRQYGRLLALSILIDELPEPSVPPSQSPSWLPRFFSAAKEDRSIPDELLKMYLAFAFLEERSQGRLPAVEGISIVKERGTKIS